MLRFSVFDHDVLTSNDFAGEVYFSLNCIPGIQKKGSLGGSADNFHGLKQFHLPIMFQDTKGMYARAQYATPLYAEQPAINI